MTSPKRNLAAAAAVLALAGCSTTPAAHATSPRPVTPPASPAALSGAQLRIAAAECAEQLELGTAHGHDYSAAVLGNQLHSHALPRSCWPLTLGQLIKAAHDALKTY